MLASTEVKQWLSDLYETVDSKEDDCGTKLAALFTDDAIMHGMSGQAVGKEGMLLHPLFVLLFSPDILCAIRCNMISKLAIAASRKEAWAVFASRKHTVLSVYSASKDFSQILIIGNLVASLKNGNQVDTEFIAQIDLEGVGEGQPRGKLYKVWGVSRIVISSVWFLLSGT
jgi:hypothetical protein